MKKFYSIVLILLITCFISGAKNKETSGYRGTLPDLIIKNNNMKSKEVIKNIDVLPLDKLTIPVKQPVKIDKVLDEYIVDITDAQKQLVRLTEILKGDKSFKNYIASANILNLTTQNIIYKYQEPRFKASNNVLTDINSDVQSIKNYWIKVNKNSPYVSVYETDGAYTGAVLNNQLNNFVKVLEYANRDLNKKIPAKE